MGRAPTGAPGLIRARYRKVRRTGDHFFEGSPTENYYTLRKRTRRLRYVSEFLSDVYGNRRRTSSGP